MLNDSLLYILPIAIAIIMLGIGLNLRFTDFKRVFIAPKAILFGLFGQLFLLPLTGFLIAFIAPVDPIYKIGIILIAACPGGTSSNIVTYMLNGRIALSVSITAFNSLLIIVSIPIILELAFLLFLEKDAEISLSMIDTFKDIFLTVLIPVLIGMTVNYLFEIKVDKIRKSLRYILPGILFIVFTVVLLNENNNDDLSILQYSELFLPAFILNVFVMFLGFYTSGWIGINHSGKFTIAIEMGLQNSALAIFIANNILQVDGLAVIAVLYGGFSFFSTLLIAYIMKRYMKSKKNIEPIV